MTTLENYRKMLWVNKHRLDDELEVQPDVMMRIASEVTVRNSRALEAKDELAREEARLFEDLKEDSEKATIEVIRGRVTRARSRIAAFEKWQRARADYEEWAAMLEAWRQRGFSMNKLVELYGDEYWTTDSASSGSRREREDTHDNARAALRRAAHTPLATAREEDDDTRRARRKLS